MLGRDDIAVFCREGAERAETEALIALCAARYAALSGVSAAGTEIVRDRRGKPDFSPDCGVYFSVSHTDGAWLCAFARQKVGLDAEKVRARETGAIVRRYFHPDEADYIGGNADRFYAVWTAKESYVKFTGEGITDGFSAFSTVAGGRIAPAVGDAALRPLFWREGYAACLAAEKVGEVAILKI